MVPGGAAPTAAADELVAALALEEMLVAVLEPLEEPEEPEEGMLLGWVVVGVITWVVTVEVPPEFVITVVVELVVWSPLVEVENVPDVLVVVLPVFGPEV